MLYSWKVPHLLKGLLTHVPALNAWRWRRASTGGSNAPRYCYAVWLRHLVTLHTYGFKVHGARIGELGPGDSIGVGLAALLSGAVEYVGLDIVPFSARADLEQVFEELVQMYSRKMSIPDDGEFPRVRPQLETYDFPHCLIAWEDFIDRAESIRKELKVGVNSGSLVKYRAPWTSPDDYAVASLDLIFSQAVLEHVDALEATYQTMFAWLKPGGYASHVIDFSAHHLSPIWNGHWAYADWEWRVVRGRREFLLNRQPLSRHIALAKKAGFEVLQSKREYDYHALPRKMLAPRFQHLGAEDAETRQVMLILRKR